MNEIENTIQELSVPLKTFRIFAIEKAIRTGKSPEILQAIKHCLQTESDSECRMLMEHAISTIEERLATTKKDDFSYDNEKILDNLSFLKPPQQLEFIKNAPRAFFTAQARENRVEKALSAIKHPVVIAELIRRCQNVWPASRLDFLETNLFSTSSVLQLACLESVIQNSTEILQRNFEKLVLAKDPLLRALAIRGLAKNFPADAAEFLSECLRKGDLYGKLAALRVCSVMSFDLIKNSLLELVFTEKDAKLLKIASAIIISNPDKEVPFRLCDQIAKTQDNRQKFLQDLLKKVCELIKISEICENFQHYLASIQKYNLNVRAKYFVLNCAERFNEASEERKQQIAEIFVEKAKTPEVIEAIKEIEKTSPSLLKGLIAPAPIEIAKSPEPKVSPEKEAEKQQEQKTEPVAEQKQDPEKLLIRELLRYPDSKKPCPIEKIDQAFRSQNSSLFAAAFRAAIWTKDKRWLNKAKSSIKSENDELVAAAFDYLAEMDPDNFLLLLRAFINTQSVLVRTTLLRNVCKISPEVARELLTSMLSDSSENLREKALASVIHFEFASIREILTEYLAKETNANLISSCLSFYQANPVLESVYDLHILQQNANFSKLFREAKESLISILDELGIANPEEINRFIQEKEQKQAKDSSNAQAAEKLKLKSIKAKVDWSGISEKISDIGSALAALKMIFVAVIALAIVFFILTRGTEPEPTTRVAVNSIPIAGNVQDYVLIVQKIDSIDNALIGLTKDKKFIRALPRPGKLFMLEQGDKVRLRALPFKIAPDGTTIVKTISLKKEK